MSGWRSEFRRARWAALAVVAAAALAGCAHDWRPNERVSFICDRGHAVTVVFRGNTASVLGMEGGPMLLERRGRDTFVYDSPTRTARLRGKNLTLTIGRMAPIRCREGGRRIR